MCVCVSIVELLPEEAAEYMCRLQELKLAHNKLALNEPQFQSFVTVALVYVNPLISKVHGWIISPVTLYIALHNMNVQRQLIAQSYMYMQYYTTHQFTTSICFPLFNVVYNIAIVFFFCCLGFNMLMQLIISSLYVLLLTCGDPVDSSTYC